MSRPNFTNFGRSGPSSPSGGRVGWIVVGIVALPFLIAWFGLAPQLMSWFSLIPERILGAPWTVVTYPLADPGSGSAFIGVLFSAYWGYMLATSLESQIRESLFLALLGVFVVLGGISLALGALILNIPGPYFGSYLPLAALTVLWATRFPETQVMLMLVIPIKAKWIGAISAGAVLFGFGSGAPLMGLFALIPLAMAFAYGSNRVPGMRFGQGPRDVKVRKKQENQFNSYMDNVRKREQERGEKEKLRRLFEASLKDDPEDKR